MYDFDKIVNRRNTSSIKYDWRKQIFDDEDVTPMWVADMDFETPSFIRNSIIERAKHPIYGYTMRSESYKRSIVNWVDTRHGWKLEPEWIIFSPGIVPALNFSTLVYTEKGDKIIAQPPVYFPFFTAATDHDRVLLENELVLGEKGYEIDFDDFETKAKEASMFFLSSPHNPVGKLWSREELLRLGNICVENNVIIIADEIHNDLILPGYKHIPLASLSKEIADITVTCIAPSKTFNLAGLATSSLIISNEELRVKMEGLINKMHLNLGNLFGAIASEAAYNHGDMWVDALMKYIAGNVDFVLKALEPSQIVPIRPEATYMLWLDFRPTGMDDDQVQQKLVKEARLGLSNGAMFGSGGSGFQRINLAAPLSLVEESVEKMVKVFE